MPQLWVTIRKVPEERCRNSSNVGPFRKTICQQLSKVQDLRHDILRRGMNLNEQLQPPCELTYRDDDRGDESPAHFEEQGRREAQHHLHIFKVVPVTCDKQKDIWAEHTITVLIRT